MKIRLQLCLFLCAGWLLIANEASASFSHNHCLSKTTCEAKAISSAGRIKRPGTYCLTRNICGTIRIDADDVTLDLNSHQINAEENDFAIYAKCKKGVTIKNGSIVRAASAGINLIGCQGVLVEDVDFRHNQDISLNVSAESIGMCPAFDVAGPSQAIVVSGCTITKGNRGMLLRGCNEVRVENCNVFENINTTPNAVVGIEHCNNVFFEEVLVNNNVKATPSQDTSFPPRVAPRAGVLLVQASNNVELKNCSTCDNTSEFGMNPLLCLGFDYNITVQPPCVALNLSQGLVIQGHRSSNNTNTTGSLFAMSIVNVPNVIAKDCETNNNKTTHASNGTTFLTQDFTAGLLAVGGKGAYIKNHQSNFNVSYGSESFGMLVGSSSLGGLADGAVIEDCVTNYNGDFNASTLSIGLDLTVGSAVAQSNGAIIRGCQSNGNAGRSSAVGLLTAWNNVDFDNCQADFNRAQGGPDPMVST